MSAGTQIHFPSKRRYAAKDDAGVARVLAILAAAAAQATREAGAAAIAWIEEITSTAPLTLLVVAVPDGMPAIWYSVEWDDQAEAIASIAAVELELAGMPHV